MLLKYGLQTGCRNFSRWLDPGTCEVYVERPCICAHPSRFEGGVHRVGYSRCMLLGRKGEYEKGRSVKTPALSYASFICFLQPVRVLRRDPSSSDRLRLGSALPPAAPPGGGSRSLLDHLLAGRLVLRR